MKSNFYAENNQLRFVHRHCCKISFRLSYCFRFKNAKKLNLLSHYLKDFTPSYYLDGVSLSKTYDMQLKQRNSPCGVSGSPCPFESESKLNAYIYINESGRIP